MPFQVSFGQKSTPIGIIQSIDAGADKIAVCDVSVTLTAIVEGDLTGHTISWEQIAGDPVSFTTQLNELTVTYSQTTFEDKVFRFYVDKGKDSERFDNVSVFGSPALNVKKSISTFDNFLFNSTPSNDGEVVNLQFLVPFPPAPHGGVGVSDTYTTATLSWNTPNTDHTVVGYIIKERNVNTGVWNDIGVLPPTDNMFNAIIIGNQYQVSAIIQYKNSYVGQSPSNTVWINGSFSGGISAVDSSTKSISVSHIQDFGYDVEKLAILTKPADHDHHRSSASANYIKSFGYDVEKLALVTKSDNHDHHRSSASANNVSAFDYDVTVLTVIEIGNE